MKKAVKIDIDATSGMPIAKPGDDFARAHDRALRVTQSVLNAHDAPSGAKVYVILTAILYIIDQRSLEVLTEVHASNVKFYSLEGKYFVEWKIGSWVDRRMLPVELAGFIASNAGLVVGATDKDYLNRFLRRSDTIYAKVVSPLQRYLLDLHALAYRSLPMVLYFHCTRILPLQLLSTGAFGRFQTGWRERCISGQYQVNIVVEPGAKADSLTHAMEISPSIAAIIDKSRELLTRKLKPWQKRRCLEDFIDEMLPLAASESRAAEIILRGALMIVRDGGVQGRALSPRTLSEYFSISLQKLAGEIQLNSAGSLDATAWNAIYQRVLDGQTGTQRNKMSAVLRAFHSYLVALGAADVRFDGYTFERKPPDANYITTRDFERACEYINKQEIGSDVKRIASAYLHLLYFIEFRTAEPWHLKIEHIDLVSGCIYIPLTKRSGEAKSDSVRRSKDLLSDELNDLLCELTNRRMEEGAIGSDYLLAIGSNEQKRRQLKSKIIDLCCVAIRWASGCLEFHLHHLRHTIFSRELSNALSRLAVGDINSLAGVSSEGGHGSFLSTLNYLHVIEPHFPKSEFNLTRQSRVDTGCLNAVFPSIDELFLKDTEPAPDEPKFIWDGYPDYELLTPVICHKILSAQIEHPDYSFQRIGVMTRSRPSDVKDCIIGFAQACVDARLCEEDSSDPVSQGLSAMVNHFDWWRVSMNSKSEGLGSALNALMEKRSEMELLWSSWCRCVDKASIDLGSARPAKRVLQFLIGAGIPQQSMAASITSDTYLIDPEIERLVGSVLHSSKPRTKKRKVHLVVSAPGRDVRLARHSAGSVAGIQWWFLVLGTWLEATRGSHGNFQ